MVGGIHGHRRLSLENVLFENSRSYFRSDCYYLVPPFRTCARSARNSAQELAGPSHHGCDTAVLYILYGRYAAGAGTMYEHDTSHPMHMEGWVALKGWAMSRDSKQPAGVGGGSGEGEKHRRSLRFCCQSAKD